MSYRIVIPVVVLMLLLALFDTSMAQEGSVVVTASTTDQRLIQTAVNKGLDVWHIDVQEGQFVATILATREEQVWLASQGFEVKVDTERTGKLNTSPVEFQMSRILNPQGFFGGYRTVEEVNAFLAAQNAAYPGIVELVNIGNSLENRPIWAIRITNEAIAISKPKFLGHFEIHARELATTELGTRLIEYLTSRFDTDPDITALLNTTEVWLVVQANPDGRTRVEQGIFWRKNTRPFGCSNTGWSMDGVDLNRNHSTLNWNTVGVSRKRCSEVYPGSNSGSEPETIAFETLVQSLFPAVNGNPFTQPAPLGTKGFMVTIHSYGNDISWPWGTGQVVADGIKLDAIGTRITQINGYRKAFPYYYETSGSTDDYAYQYARVPSFLYEIGTEFSQLYSDVQMIWEQNLPTFLYGIRLAGNPYTWYAGPEMTDGSGWVGGSVNPGIQTQVFADFPGAVTVRYFLDTTDNSVVTTTQGIPATIQGDQVPNGRHTVIAQGCRANGCGPFYGIGFLESSPTVWVNNPIPLNELVGPTQVTFSGSAASYGGVNSVEIQFCPSGINCSSWEDAGWNGTSWSSTWNVPGQESRVNSLTLKVRINVDSGPFMKSFLYGVNEPLRQQWLPVVWIAR